MSEKVNSLLEKIKKLETELESEIHEQANRFKFKVEGKAVIFDEAVVSAHKKLRVNILRWLGSSLLRNVLSAPFIYAMIIPIAFMDLTVTIYQHICFRLYRIPRVERSKYIVMDRHQLSYLNAIEKLNCLYCGYGNGVIGYAREIFARTEQYWCPIKHARKALGTHRHYSKFLGFGDAEDFETRILKFREAMSDK
ncbi:MAG: hypothetical protein WDZ52_14910 [Pseudohongiellaceae bacterium]